MTALPIVPEAERRISPFFGKEYLLLKSLNISLLMKELAFLPKVPIL